MHFYFQKFAPRFPIFLRVLEKNENILKRKTFKTGCSVNDLVDLDGVNNQQDLFRKFEAGIMSVIESIDEEKVEPLSAAS